MALNHETMYWAPQRKLGGGWICFKSSPKAPAAPDPVATAKAQTDQNIATATAQANLNRVNQVTPWGSQTYSQGDLNADGTRTWTQTTSLDPAQQRLLDSSNQLSQGMADLGQTQIGQVANAINNPMNTSGMQQVRNSGAQNSVDMTGVPQMQTNVQRGAIQGQVGDAGALQRGVAGSGPMQTSFDAGGQVQGTAARSGPVQARVGSGGDIQRGVQGAGQIQSAYENGGRIQDSVANAGKIQAGINTAGTEEYTRAADGGPLQRQVDMSGVTPLVGGDALRGTMEDSQKAAYGMQSQYLDRDYKQRERDMENKLIQQGVLQGSDAWNREMQNLGAQRTFDYNNAFNNSFDKGMSAQGQLFGQGLAVNQNAYGQAVGNGQFANSAQAQAFGQSMENAKLNNSVSSQLAGQRLSQGQFANAAQGQQYGQNANDAAFANTAQAQRTAQSADAARFRNDAQGQQYGQNSNDMDQANDAQAQQFGQGVTQGNFVNNAQAQQFAQNGATTDRANAAQAQRFGQNLQAMQAGNTARGQEFAQNLAQGQFGNDAQQAQFAQLLASMQAGNQAQGQAFQQDSSNAALNNGVSESMYGRGLAGAQLNNSASAQQFNQDTALRGNQMQEAYQQQQNPINILNALRSGSQVSAPQFGSVAQTNMGQTDIAGMYQNKFQADMAGFNAKQAQNNAMTSGLFGLAGSFLGMPPVGSDRRIKENIVHTGTRADGLHTYDFDYKPEFKSTWGAGRFSGVMADEVERIYPHAVTQHADGYKMVNYGALA